MKARVKETGAIFQVLGVVSNTADGYALSEVDLYCDESDNLVVGVSEDYWEKLKHQYAGMAMQGILANQDYCKLLIDENQLGSFADDVSRCAKDFATALVEKLKGE